MFKVHSTPVSVVAAAIVVAATTLALAASAPRAYATSSTTPTNTCIDGSKRANLQVTWNAHDSVSFVTTNNKLLCNDVTVFFSSYTMPDNYNGKDFTNNPTATPQTIFDSASYVMAKGTTGAHTLKIDLPEACKNIQVDLYYAPEVKDVTPAGHGTQYITGKIISKTADTCTPVTPDEPTTPAVPQEEAQTPSTPPAAVTVTPQAPVELPHTGSEAILPIAVASIVAAISYAGSMIFKRQ
jgi:hypothetical protein